MSLIMLQSNLRNSFDTCGRVHIGRRENVKMNDYRSTNTRPAATSSGPLVTCDRFERSFVSEATKALGCKDSKKIRKIVEA